MTTAQLSMPSLRFMDEQGNNYPDWEENRLGEVAQFYSGGTPTTTNKQYYAGNIPFIKSGEIGLSITEQCISDQGLKNSSARTIKAGDILYALYGATSGEVAISKIDGAINQAVLCIRSQLSHSFIFYYLSHKKDTIVSTFLQGGQGNLSAGIIKSLKFNFPSPEEQQKIATFLSSVDIKIEQLNKNKSLLEQYKQGMMQRLFSQQIRFKDEQGEEYPDWEVMRFSDLYSFKTSNSFSREKLNYKKGKIRNIHYGDIHTKYKARFILNKEDVPYLSTDIKSDSISGDTYCKEGDLVIADASEDYEGIGKVIELLYLNNEPVLAGLHTLLARLNSDKIYIGYGAYVMACDFVRYKIMKIAQGTKVLGISMGRMNEIELPIPDKKEQKKIADFLSTIDKKIELVTEQIKQAQTFKKGLLQQMFV